jgi:hypothetical protein
VNSNDWHDDPDTAAALVALAIADLHSMAGSGRSRHPVPGFHVGRLAVAARTAPVMQLRFRFAAPTLRAAVDLAGAMRKSSAVRVQVRPGGRRDFTSGRWCVIVTTRSAALGGSAAELWEERLRSVAAREAGCVMVGWGPVL